MRVTMLFFTVLLGGLGAAARATPPARLQLLTELSAPSSMLEDGQVVGRSTEKVREIMARSGIDFTLELLPWQRAFTLARDNADTCVFSTTRTAERESQFKWIGPIDDAEWALLARADRMLQLRTLEDARPLRIGTYNGDARDIYLRAQGFKVDPAPNDAINARKLLMGRIDAWAISVKRGEMMLKRYGQDSRIVPVLTFNRVRVYLACNLALPGALSDKMNAAVEAMGRDGTLQRIDRKYEKWDADAQGKPSARPAPDAPVVR